MWGVSAPRIQLTQGTSRAGWPTLPCRKGLPCPLDIAHEHVAASLRCDPDGVVAPLADERGTDFEEWAGNHPVVAGHLVWLHYEEALAAGDRAEARKILALAEANALHRADPRLAVTIASLMLGRADPVGAVETLEAARRPGSTDPAQVGVEAALTRIAAHGARTAAPASDPAPNRSRPPGRVRPNQFRPWATPPSSSESSPPS